MYKEEEEDDVGSLVLIFEVVKVIMVLLLYFFKLFKLGLGLFVDGSKQICDFIFEVLKEILLLFDDGEFFIDLLLSLGMDEY